MDALSPAAINERIRKYRFADAEVRVLKPDGTPLANAEVTIGQTKHAFHFGAIGFELVTSRRRRRKWSDEQLEGYKARLLELMNYATMPFYWTPFEPEEGQTIADDVMDACRWLQAQGFTLKGHPLCWHEASTADWLLALSPEAFMDKQLERIRRDVAAFAGVVDSWDVINEVIVLPDFTRRDNAVTRAAQTFGAQRIAELCFDAARETSADATLLINDFKLTPAYEQLIEKLLARQTPIDAIGLQTHQHHGYLGAEAVWDVCERFARFGLPLHFTETTILSGQLVPKEIPDLPDVRIDPWPTTPEGEQRQCEEVVEFYSLLYSHPAVEAIVWWGIVDGGWLGAPNGLVRRDMSPKPAFEELRKRIKGEWWTPDQMLPTDAHGIVRFNGALGDYHLTADGRRTSFSIDRNAATGEVRLP